MASTRSSRKRQSRLTFTPLPSSSPATRGYHKQIQDRAAAVGYDGSPNPAKRRRLQDRDEVSADRTNGMVQLDGVNDRLPTPAATMDRHKASASDEEEDSEPIRPTQRRSRANDQPSLRSRTKQRQLDFSNVRDSDTFDSPVKLSSSANPRSSAQSGIFSSRTRGTRQQPVVNLSSDESEASGALPSADQLVSKSRASKGEESNKGLSPGSKRSRATRSSQRPIVLESSEEDEDDVIIVGGEGASRDGIESEEEAMPTTAGKQSRTRRRQRSPDCLASSSPPRAIDSDDDVMIIEKPNGRRSKRGDREDMESEEEIAATPSRRKSQHLGRRLTQQDKDDLAEDMDLLGPSSDTEALDRTPNTTQSKQKSARQAALEALKRKRSGQSNPIEPIPEEVEDEEVEEEEEEPLGIPDEFYEDDEDEIEEVLPQPTSSRQMFNADKDDEDFIEEEEDGEASLSIPEGIPIQFTQYARQKAKDLFKHAIEWMVQKKINPAFKMTDEIYALTFRKLDDEVKGLAGSKFVSAAWTPDFTFALRARPVIAFEPIDRQAEEHYLRDKCDACNRSGHPATYQIQFQGTPYHPTTLEEVGTHDDDDDEDDDDASDTEASSTRSRSPADDATTDDQPAYDHQGRELAPASTIYYVGKFCMANAETAHSLSHWRYHLHDWVVTWLARNGYSAPEKVVQRDGWSTKKRRKYANKIADRMERDGVVKQLWGEFRKNVEEARSSKQGRFTVGDD